MTKHLSQAHVCWPLLAFTICIHIPAVAAATEYFVGGTTDSPIAIQKDSVKRLPGGNKSIVAVGVVAAGIPYKGRHYSIGRLLQEVNCTLSTITPRQITVLDDSGVAVGTELVAEAWQVLPPVSIIANLACGERTTLPEEYEGTDSQLAELLLRNARQYSGAHETTTKSENSSLCLTILEKVTFRPSLAAFALFGTQGQASLHFPTQTVPVISENGTYYFGRPGSSVECATDSWGQDTGCRRSDGERGIAANKLTKKISFYRLEDINSDGSQKISTAKPVGSPTAQLQPC